MNRRQYVTMALMAGLGILAAGVAVIASRKSSDRPPESSIDAIRTAGELIRLRMNGTDSAAKRRALKTAAGKLPPSPFRRALSAFAEGDLNAAVREPAESPFAWCVRGWLQFELGQKSDAAESLTRGLSESQPEWEYRTLFEEALSRVR